MALKKSLTLPNGSQGNYIKLVAFSWDSMNKRATADFHLFTSKLYADTAPEQPLGQIAKLRLEGAKFDEYLSSAALGAMKNPGADPLRSALYLAAQSEGILPGMGFTRSQLSLSDAVRED